ncbi:conserved hypothetical membrane spanning protein [Desulforamulus reducens MI-1]|uniref:Conserved hypothetical membrane spanning protein n=1 Tax=Desulforamulus reducens (strain ATCC BAA-1160 / DSM 100696 / MI-1) TaxID=349161 RepID=A4J8P5_DESRM|nr:DUF3147 family protein [Desulforamulus reducens]ABO51448.1 conserved hypothetical membrane spanning protein [Desulforamulus reducens MI-1]
MGKNILDLMLRFVLGGLAVALCYILLILIPWKSVAGIFAAFPAVMVSALIITGMEKGSKEATNIAYGAVAGNIGGLVCVMTVLLGLALWQNVTLAISIGLIAWFVASAVSFSIYTAVTKEHTP